MEENKIFVKSIWGTWWTSFRKWFYPAWLIYETCIRFYEYSVPVHHYFMNFKENIGSTGAQFLAILCSSLTFTVCFLFLTVPGSIALFKYFKTEELSNNKFEQNLKYYF